jgi:NRPS condensation-like uncharacterized protein
MEQLTICRKLDPAERFFWLLDRVSGMNFVVFAEIDGSLAPVQIRRALELAQAAYPLLRVKIEYRPPNDLWLVPAQAPLFCKELSVDQHTWQAPIEAELSHPFPLGDAPLMRCHYLTFSDARRSMLALSFHHAIADGRSGTALLREILQYLAKPDEVAHFNHGTIHPPMHAAFPAQYHWHNQPQAASDLHEVRKRELKQHGRPSVLPWLAVQEPKRAPRFQRIVLDAAHTRRLIARCRQYGATLHGALSAAQLIAQYRSIASGGAHTLSLGHPADMRPYLEGQIPASSLGLYVTLLYGAYRLDDRASFWELACTVSLDLKRQLARGDGHLLFTHIQPEAVALSDAGLADFSTAMLASPHSSMISNIGAVDAVDPSLSVKAISFVLCPMPYQLVFSAVSTFDEQLTINMVYDSAKLLDQRASQLAQWIEQSLCDNSQD